MKFNFKFMLQLSFIMISVVACNSHSGYNVTNFDFSVECMGTELDGSQTLKAWGKGRNYFDASEQAKKNAVREVIFKGIHSGSNICSKDPILLAPRAETINEEYFAKFFADGGEYSNYVSLKDEHIKNKLSRNKKKQSESSTRMVVVRVDRFGLKQKFKEDKIY